MVDKNNENVEKKEVTLDEINKELENEDNQITLEDLEEEVNVIRAEEEIAEEKEFLVSEDIKREGKFVYYSKVLLTGIFDQILAIGLALVLFGILTLILKVAGYEIVTKDTMFTILYIISNVLYYPIIQEMLHGKTLARKLLFR